VLLSGVDLNTLIGKRFSIGEVVFEGTEECTPCHWLNGAIGPGVEDFLKGRAGSPNQGYRKSHAKGWAR